MLQCRKPFLYIHTLLLMINIPIYATTYYISSSTGNDVNNGTSPGSSWRSLDKIFAKTPAFQAGDSILLKRGDTFDG